MPQIIALELDNKLNSDTFRILLEHLPVEKQAKINRFRQYEDALRTLFGELLVRVSIMDMHGLTNDNIQFHTNRYGKPFLVHPDTFHFNISHSGHWIVLAIDSSPVGIDIEKIQPIDLSIAERFFSKNEHADLIKKPPNAQLSYFYDLWSLKESYIKYIGKGLSQDLKSFSIRCDNGIFKLTSQEEMPRCFFTQYDIDPDYKLSLCTLYKNSPSTILIKSCDELIKEFLAKK
ncbi:4'-phosphopantetheinyl transferase superfamily protein [Paenibacillus sp.]|jgi:4'-phosphopantetheinyl transferase|uniref:4'-phosphopantetheinyl transferase family protein n=1 Tax=Paenibacillus sp. TaxID=58172 RepID=UPI002819A5E4|nr:4'-phosphopantetheinyl transferase superfamily protein [Paenibacillus sp.]MDR0269768.1 4'-phosphopantetheinyl transferase superfamily protein [Paenibacillus sp.]